MARLDDNDAGPRAGIRAGALPLRLRWRRFVMGLSTLLGRPRGFFSPYRYAGSVSGGDGYPEIEAILGTAWDEMESVLGVIAEEADALAAFRGPAPRPRWDQLWFPRLDGAAAYVIAAGSGAGRVVEVGSGHSTRFLAQALDDAGQGGRITCIDPEPRAVLDGLDVEWRREVLGPQHLPLFDALEPGDIAFFDSSHLLWPGTDVDMIFSRILPRLAPGVLVHLHDIFLPDPYPVAWEWRGYTEQTGLAGWLASGAYKPIWASHFARTRMGAAEAPGVADLPMPEGAFESSLWLVRAAQ
ncbi:class I SAM-dependent methyltransferase [Limibaculum sp. M0105]|uniref:Class I SAM-dependent methyltransferase n=1 Tax=Thermohalobaculum xanthum TaxID=2753746 RepID=A0A8J7SD26_9RHOB|nr:class I SAM-dependent methyltransferase [Thermohalobaculum xanthum]MBK0398983.1 class I SAM-dependent methyltransferase [Thermohalobaculum xanthum]